MKKVDIYTSETCGYCAAAKEFLRENNVTFIEHNITSDSTAKKELMQMGYRSVPLIIFGDHEISGFDRDELIRLLKL